MSFHILYGITPQRQNKKQKNAKTWLNFKEK